MSLSQQAEYKAYETLYKKCLRYIEQMQYEFRRDFTKRAEDCIDDWYADYPNRRYKPRHGLYEAYNVSYIDYGVNVEYGHKFMETSHHQKNEIIYNNAFVSGYHGGSWGTNKKGPHPGASVPDGEPHYRVRIPWTDKDDVKRIGFYDWDYDTEVPKSEPLLNQLMELEDEVFKEVDHRLCTRLRNAWKTFVAQMGW